MCLTTTSLTVTKTLSIQHALAARVTMTCQTTVITTKQWDLTPLWLSSWWTNHQITWYDTTRIKHEPRRSHWHGDTHFQKSISYNLWRKKLLNFLYSFWSAWVKIRPWSILMVVLTKLAPYPCAFLSQFMTWMLTFSPHRRHRLTNHYCTNILSPLYNFVGVVTSPLLIKLWSLIRV